MDKKVVIVYVGLSWIIGTLDLRDNSSFVVEPKLYLFNGQSHGIMALPGDPPEIEIGRIGLMYELPPGEAMEIYKKATQVIDVAPADIITVQ